MAPTPGNTELGVEAEYGEAAKNTPASLPALRAVYALFDLEKACLEGVYQQLMARIKLEWARGRDLDG